MILSAWTVGYTAGFFAAISMAVGALGLLMIARLSGAIWIVPLRRAAEALMGTLPIFLVLFIPIALQLAHIYPWASKADLSALGLSPEASAALAHTRAWWNSEFFVVRAYFYISLWSALAFGWRKRPDGVSAVGLLLLIITFSLAGFDWMMSLDTGWVSDAFGFYVATGAFAGAVGLVVVFSVIARRTQFLPRSAITENHFSALGRVLLTAVILWAYIAFCQFLIIWIADLPSEIPFYDDRRGGIWKWVTAAVVLGQFVVPFILLLSRNLKRHPARLGWVGAWVVAGHVLDVSWMTFPAGGRSVSLLALLPMFGVLGVFIGFAAWRYKVSGALAESDSDREASLHYEAA
ncbi:MAG: hypothetical protein ABI461_21335 [Polyangiaceae bacterium]